ASSSRSNGTTPTCMSSAEEGRGSMAQRNGTTRRRILAGGGRGAGGAGGAPAAGGAIGSRAITGIPFVHAAEPVTLRIAGTGVNQFKELADKAKAELGFTIQYTSLVSDDVVKRAVTQ